MNPESPKKILSNKELRHKMLKVLVEEYLNDLKEKRPIKPRDMVTVFSGPYAHKGMLVIRIDSEKGKIEVLPSPESKEAVSFDESELWSFDDYRDAFAAAIQEVGIDIPEIQNN